MEKYIDEKAGQIDFFKSYIKLVDSTLTEDDILNDNNDGVINGNILEFKPQISNLNAVLFQTIKYLSSLRIKGKPIPANILLVSLHEGKAYVYHSADYLDRIEQVYSKAASLSNEGFVCGSYNELLSYKDNEIDEARLIEILREKQWTKINIDENCIVGWATRYYKENASAQKSDFIGDTEGKVKIIGEIRRPTHFKDYINPYIGKTNEKFKYLMDKLNDTIQKKELGAFYTAELYADKSLELLRKAIARVPEGNDYIILDRCAGTGNLERHLSEEELGHCILSTIEYYEYKVLVETLGDKVRHIIPPTLALAELKRLTVGPKEKELLEQWQKVLADAKKTENYNSDIKYGVYQIYDELNTSYKDDETDATIYDYPSLNGNLATLKTLVKQYYLSEIVPMLFEYEFLK